MRLLGRVEEDTWGPKDFKSPDKSLFYTVLILRSFNVLNVPFSTVLKVFFLFL